MLFTVGHSTNTIEEFQELLKNAGVEHVVDVRTLPGSTKFPHFNQENLEVSLPAAGITYDREEDLGGLRRKTSGIDKETNAMWQNASFHRYADWALTEPFHEALSRLLLLADQQNVAVMCAEAVWWRCHRRIIADYAIASGRDVRHLMPGGRIAKASLTPGALIVETDPPTDLTVAAPEMASLNDVASGAVDKRAAAALYAAGPVIHYPAEN